MVTEVIQVLEPACDDRGWVVRIQEICSGMTSERLQWYEDESSAAVAYRVFLRQRKIAASQG